MRDKNYNFEWVGIKNGKNTRGIIVAPSLNLAKLKLSRLCIKPFSLSKKKTFSFNKKKISTQQLIFFFKQLASLLSSGIPIIQVLEILSEHCHNPNLAIIQTALKDNLANGKQLAWSLAKFPKHFDKMTCYLVEAGEQSGKLIPILENIAENKEKNLKFTQEIKQAIFYPLLVLTMAFVVLCVMVIFIIPRFMELYQNLNTPLPRFTASIFYFSCLIKNHLGFISLSVCTLFLLYYCSRSQLERTTDRVILKIPWLGRQIKKLILARWMRILSVLFAAGIPITEVLKLTQFTIKNILYREAIQHLIFNISRGKQLYVAMQENHLFPSITRQLIRVGEESGTLEQSLQKIAELYEAEINYLFSHLTRLIEPLIMMILGVLIGGLIIAIYLPIFKLGSAL